MDPLQTPTPPQPQPPTQPPVPRQLSPKALYAIVGLGALTLCLGLIFGIGALRKDKPNGNEGIQSVTSNDSAEAARRDTARKAAVARLLAAAEQMASNSEGVYPVSCTEPASFAPDTGTGAYNPGNSPALFCRDSGGINQASILYTSGEDCDGVADPRSIKAEVKLEIDSADYCRDNI